MAINERDDACDRKYTVMIKHFFTKEYAEAFVKKVNQTLPPDMEIEIVQEEQNG